MASIRQLPILLAILQLGSVIYASLEPEGQADFCYLGSPGCNRGADRSLGALRKGFLAGTCVTGRKQSPIDIPPVPKSQMKGNVSLSPAYFKDHQFRLTNSHGHTLQGDIKGDHELALEGSLMEGDKYILDSFHFHWGSAENGSEHTMDGKMFAAEMHFVHYNAKYGTKIAAIRSGDPKALAVIGVLFEQSNKDNVALQRILDLANNVVTPLAVTEGVDLNLSPLILNGGTRITFAHYLGSLTTPGCDELVLWNVNTNPQPISVSQLEAFRSLETSRGKAMVDNVRAPQALNGRNVQFIRATVAKNNKRGARRKNKP